MKREKQHKEYIAFDGVKYTIEWYFDEKGKSISLDYLESLSDKEQIKLLALFIVSATHGYAANLIRFIAGLAGYGIRSSKYPKRSLGFCSKNRSAAVVLSERWM